jgi:hypothetical protein
MKKPSHERYRLTGQGAGGFNPAIADGAAAPVLPFGFSFLLSTGRFLYV